MFDAQTVDLIRSAPPLEGLELDNLPKVLTQAYSRIVSLRMRLRAALSPESFEAELGDMMRELETIALTQEAFVAVTPDRENRASAAFVAASAHQLRFSAERLLNPEEASSRLMIEAIAPEIASTLMFLIAGRAADAAQMSRRIRFGDGQSAEDNLRRSIADLARGQLENIVNRERTFPDELAFGDDAAATALWAELIRGVRVLAARLLARNEAAETDPAAIFAGVREVCVDPVVFDGTAQVFSVFPGPHHLASLLHGASGLLTKSAVVSIPAPPGVPFSDWRSFLKELARRRPYLWPNHSQAVASGYLDPQTSAVVSFPTGAGKSTLAELKIGAARLLGKKVVFLAPTLALVDQVTSDLKRTFPEAETTLADELEPEDLTDIAVMTPERCLTLMGFSPGAFEDVGLLVFDECHLLHPRESSGRRSIDAMLCLLRFMQCVPAADVLLVSAMVKNADDLAAWLGELTNRPCLSLALSWKPTRQARGCVVYKDSRASALQTFINKTKQTKMTKAFPARKLPQLTAQPIGMISLLQTWQTKDTDDYVLLPLLDDKVQLAVSKYWKLTANRNAVAAALGAASAEIGMKTLVFAAQPAWCGSIEKAIEERLPERSVKLTPDEKTWLAMAIAECGGNEHSYCRADSLAASHHGQLLPVERQLNESKFRRSDGIHAMVATSTLAQGMNLPSQVVIIAGDDRFDAVTNKATLLEAHELLNAAGRAGRAGEAAEGLVILVPGKVIAFDEQKNTITGHWFELQSIFSNSDQCLEIEDPLEPILDRLHVRNGDLGTDEAYFLRRLPFTVSEAGEPSRRLLQSTLAAFKAKRKGDDQWISQRIESSLRRREDALGTEENVSWEDELASSTGALDAAQIRSIADRFDQTVGEPVGSVSKWIDWGLGWLDDDPARLGLIARPSTVGAVFGKSVEGFDSDPTKASLALSRIREVMPLWIGGKPLNEIEVLITGKKAGKCGCAREWALRLAPELAYFFGLTVQIFQKHRLVGTGIDPALPLAFAKHGRCLREGFDHPDKLALRQVLGALAPRVVVHHRYAELDNLLDSGADFESLADAARRIRKAIKREKKGKND